jgi:hypothetical protein
VFLPEEGMPGSSGFRGSRAGAVDEQRAPGSAGAPKVDFESSEDGHPGPAFDDTMRSLMEGDLPGACELLNIPVDGEPELLPSEFPAWSKRLDLLIRVAPRRLAHVEYARRGEKAVVTQMLWYRCLVMRKYPDHHLDQYVLVLGGGRVRGHDDLEGRGFALKLALSYLREQDAQWFLNRPPLAPLAVLARGGRQERAKACEEAIRVIHKTGGERTEELLDFTNVLATITLDRQSMHKVLEEVGMTIETIMDFYQDSILGQGFEAKGREQGLEQGREQALIELITERFGSTPAAAETAHRLASWPSGAVHAVISADSLDELVGLEPPH